jgi:hypothetical protein
MEMFFEEFNFPATYFPATPMLGAFMHGRPTGLVVDLGASHTTVSPVVDGHVLLKSVMTTSRGGNWLDARLHSVLSREHIVVKPWYEKEGFPIHNIKTSASFRNFHVGDVMRDLKHWMCLVPPTPLDAAGSHARVPYMPSYELPDGTMVEASDNLCLVTEQLFAPGRTRVAPVAAAKTPGSSSAAAAASAAPKGGVAGILSAPLMPGVPTHSQRLDIDPSLDPLHELIFASIAKCDADCRKEIASNIMLIGGGSLMDGLQPRLAADLTSLLPSQLKVGLLVLYMLSYICYVIYCILCFILCCIFYYILCYIFYYILRYMLYIYWYCCYCCCHAISHV